jgi:hypothetical protein
MKFRLEETRRTALFSQSSKVDFDQTGWGLAVKLAQTEGSMRGDATLIISDPAQIKMFNDAEIGASFEITVKPAK